MLHVIYRISGGQKSKPGQFSDWKSCLKNFLNEFSNCADITFVCDNLSEEIDSQLVQLGFADRMIRTSLGNSGSFLKALETAITAPVEDIIYLVEDDYLHRPNAARVLCEGFDTGADYVSLYDHADKYMVYYSVNSWGGEPTKVLLTESTHWKQVSSTTMTFAAKVKTLREDYDLIKTFLKSSIPEDWAMFMALKNKDRKLVNPIPGYATHCIQEYTSPLIDWKSYVG